MDIQLLKVFFAAAQEGSISKAAQKLNFAQSNVTHKIQQLESDLQTPLFYRHNRGIKLTPPGQILFAYTEKILHIVQEARLAVGNSSVPSGPLRIGAMETTAAVRLPRLLARYHLDYPAVDLSLVTGPSEPHIQSVLHYELNGAFVAGPVDHTELIQERVVDEELVLITPVSHPHVQSFQEVTLRTLLVFHNGCTYRALLKQMLQDEGIVPDNLMEFGSIETIIGCVEAGLGISLVPRSIADEPTKQGRIRANAIANPRAVVSTVFIRRKDALASPAMTAFLAQMHALFPDT